MAPVVCTPLGQAVLASYQEHLCPLPFSLSELTDARDGGYFSHPLCQAWFGQRCSRMRPTCLYKAVLHVHITGNNGDKTVTRGAGALPAQSQGLETSNWAGTFLVGDTGTKDRPVR